MKTYTIRAGDTFQSISNKLNISVSDILAANPGVKPEELQVEQVISFSSDSHSSSNSHSSPSEEVPGSQEGTQGGGGYEDYTGSASNFPNPSRWQKYSLLWESNAKLMKYHDNDSEISLIKQAIERVARESGIDVRVILCIIMQESAGNVRVGSTSNGVTNPGLMQSHNGASFSPHDPSGSILQMVRDGTEGTKLGDGLKQLYARYGNYYEAFRAYNLGSVDKNNLNDALGATQWYVRDAANRLMGHQWNGM